MKRRDFLGFFLIGGLISHVMRKLLRRNNMELKKAAFWRNVS